MVNEMLGTYLNDHYAGATGALELVERVRSESDDDDLQGFLGRLERDVEADRDTLEEIMVDLGHEADPVREAGGWMAEKLSQLRFHEQVSGSAKISRLMQLETLTLGIEGKLALWQTLQTVADGEIDVDVADLDELERRARKQLEELEQHRRAVARDAFTG